MDQSLNDLWKNGKIVAMSRYSSAGGICGVQQGNQGPPCKPGQKVYLTSIHLACFRVKKWSIDDRVAWKNVTGKNTPMELAIGYLFQYCPICSFPVRCWCSGWWFAGGNGNAPPRSLAIRMSALTLNSQSCQKCSLTEKPCSRRGGPDWIRAPLRCGMHEVRSTNVTHAGRSKPKEIAPRWKGHGSDR